MPPLLRRMLHRLAVGFSVLLLVGSWWNGEPGGAGTRAVLAISARICPDAAADNQMPTVGNGAHALDRAMLRRLAVALGVGVPCFVA
jgi:hypothetical protein